MLGLGSSSVVGTRSRAGLALFAAALLVTLGSTSAAQAASVTVTNTGDAKGGTCPSPSSCTLRDALNNAENGEVVSLTAGTYTLNGAEGAVEIEANVSIVGAGASTTTITASPASALIDVDDAEVTLSGITFRGGVAGASGHEGSGGALTNDGGKVLISNSAFTDNTANGETTNASYDYGGYGGAIYNDDGELVVSHSSFTSNTAAGGANADEYAEGGYGGAIYSEDGELTVS